VVGEPQFKDKKGICDLIVGSVGSKWKKPLGGRAVLTEITRKNTNVALSVLLRAQTTGEEAIGKSSPAKEHFLPFGA